MENLDGYKKVFLLLKTPWARRKKVNLSWRIAVSCSFYIFKYTLKNQTIHKIIKDIWIVSTRHKHFKVFAIYFQYFLKNFLKNTVTQNFKID